MSAPAPTPRFVPAVPADPAAPPPALPRRTASVTPLYPSAAIPASAPGPAGDAAAASPTAGAAPGARRAGRPDRWTVLVVPPARAPGAVRQLALGARHGWLALLAAAAALGATVYGAAHLGATAREQRFVAEVAQLHARLDAAELRLRSLGDSVGVLDARTSALAAAHEAAERESARRAAAARAAARRGAPARTVALVPAPGVLLPVDGRITSRFARRRLHPILRINRPHRGLDIAAPAGAPIRAPAAGRVTRVARELGYGLVVHVEHGGGLTTRYAHCRSVLVAEGETVAAGATIATVGKTGLATAPHLHYEVRRNGTAVDPLTTPVE